nr:unnamed protein product [Digitaria exilis]
MHVVIINDSRELRLSPSAPPFPSPPSTVPPRRHPRYRTTPPPPRHLTTTSQPASTAATRQLASTAPLRRHAPARLHRRGLEKWRVEIGDNGAHWRSFFWWRIKDQDQDQECPSSSRASSTTARGF